MCCNIINVFTVTFDGFNVFLLNKSIYFFLTLNLNVLYNCYHKNIKQQNVFQD